MEDSDLDSGSSPDHGDAIAPVPETPEASEASFAPVYWSHDGKCPLFTIFVTKLFASRLQCSFEENRR